MTEDAATTWVRLEDVPEAGTDPTDDRAGFGRWRDIAGVLPMRTFGVSVHTIWPGQCNTSYHRHSHQAEFFAVLAGRGHIVLGQERYPLRAGDCVYVPPGVSHTLDNSSELPLSALIFGTNEAADVIERPPLPARLQDAARATSLMVRPDELGEEDARFKGHPFGPRLVRPVGKALGVHGFEVDVQDVPPGAYNASHHRHSVLEELFFVLSGNLTVLDEGHEAPIERWCTYYAAPGRRHVIRNTGTKDARLLIFSDPTPPNDSVSYYDLQGNPIPRPAPPPAS